MAFNEDGARAKIELKYGRNRGSLLLGYLNSQQLRLSPNPPNPALQIYLKLHPPHWDRLTYYLPK